MMWVQFGYTDGGVVGFQVRFNDALVYGIGQCGQFRTIPKEKLGTDRNRIWTIEKEDPRVKLSCNGVQIIDMQTASENEECKNHWAVDFVKMRFIDDSGGESGLKDTASDYVRPYKAGNKEIITNKHSNKYYIVLYFIIAFYNFRSYKILIFIDKFIAGQCEGILFE